MEITVNQQNYSIADHCSLQHMVTTVLKHSVSGIAIAVNQEIISKRDWENYSLKPGDNITIIKATQGG